MLRRRSIALPVVALLTILTARVRAEAPATQPAPDTYIRFVDDQHGGGALQTADVEFSNKDGVVVHLVAAIHIGEKSYYEALNKDFQNYDAVLYELVKSKETPVPTPGEAADPAHSNPIGDFQRMLKSALDLDFQLDDIDYTAKNFVHADMDKETFEKMQAERGETFEELMIKQIMKSFTEPAPDEKQAPDLSIQDMIKVFTRPDGERQIKVVIAKQLGNMDTSAMGLDGPGGSVIVTERNKAAFKVLADTIAGGKKKIAIFYGGAHMPDMSKRLADMGFSPVSTHWNQAWDLAIRADQPSEVEKMLNSLLDGDNDNN